MRVKGIGASEGITMGKVFKLDSTELTIPMHTIDDVEQEINILQKAIHQTINEIKSIRTHIAKTMDEDHASIFDAHIEIAQDPEMLNQVNNEITLNKYNAAYAYKTIVNQFIQLFDNMSDEYLKERVTDLKDVSRRVLSHILGVKLTNPSMIQEEVIIVADDLTPSDTAQLNKKFVKGFITNIGGRTSHSAIMARSLEIPAIVGTKNITSMVTDNDNVLLNALNGEVIINPTDEEILQYKQEKLSYLEKKAVWSNYINEKSVTSDGKHVEIAANIGSLEDVSAVLRNGAEGIGLYRTEFLYMNNKELPTEEQQYKAYKKVLEYFKNQKVIIRTLDTGGDKQIDYIHIEPEQNPFLGQRALRLCLDQPELFKTQLRALLKASLHGDLHIMFPMVATLDELLEAKGLLNMCKKELDHEGIPYSDTLKVGMMVEIPSVAILADQFAKEVDFFSIGTNDLIQYTFAADRMNEKVSYLYQPYNPALLKLIKMVIDASHNNGIWTGLCGEIATDDFAAAILLGLGLDEFSMSAGSIPKIRHFISSLSYIEMKRMAETCLTFSSNDEVKAFVKRTLNKI